jgi:hypothetical protein
MKNIGIENIKAVLGNDVANKIFTWWNDREILLALSTLPGSGELILLKSILELTQAPIYRLECGKSTSKIELHSLLKQSLNDENEDVIVLMEKIEEVHNQESFQILLLEFLQQGFINESDLMTTIAPKSGKPPHLIIISNQKTEKIQESLHRPIARRSIFAQLAN